jgi:hypothetical protein
MRLDIPAVGRHQVYQLPVAHSLAAVVTHATSIAISGEDVKGVPGQEFEPL